MTDRLKLFDRWAANYDDTLLDATGFPFEGYRDVLQRLYQLAEPRPGLRVLDLGTGTGALASLFAAAGCQVTGIDFSEEMLARARERVPTAEFTRVDLLDEWPAEMQGRSYDRVVSSYVLHEFPDGTKIELLERLAQVSLTPGGMILIGDILFADAASRSAAHEEWRHAWDEEEHYAAAHELIPALRSRGLTASFESLSFCAGVLTVKH